MADQKNLLLAIVISVLIMLGFQYFVAGPKVEKEKAQQQTAQQQASPAGGGSVTVPGASSTAPPVPGQAAPVPAKVSREAALAASPRVRIDTPRLRGSLALIGGRIDDLSLLGYHNKVAADSGNIILFSPTGAPKPYYAEFGWTAAGEQAVKLPDSNTLWSTSRNTLTPDSPVVLTWDNGEGLRFIRTYAVDRNYMITVSQKVENYGGTPVTLYPYALVSRHGTPKTLGYYILHEGALGVLDGTLKEVDYKEMKKDGRITQPSTGGWIGITDKYWLAALIPDQSQKVTAAFSYQNDGEKYQVDYLLDATAVPAGGTAEVRNRLFAGAKEVRLLEKYMDEEGVERFDLAIDWGWFYFLTRPMFFALDYFYGLLGNFGLSILLTTAIIKLFFLPLAHKSYVSMSKMKKLQPEMAKLRERFGDDRTRMNQELMALYKKEKVNPASGCLPIVLQIPVFFSLYKVLFVTIEMRHAPFFGWITDLSAPDPTNLFNLFGLISWSPPAFLPVIGVWPLLMGLSMFLQQRLNPQPTDPVQAKIFMFLPLFFIFLLARFPAGLVIYWTWNNLLSMTQQWFIMKRMGVKP